MEKLNNSRVNTQTGTNYRQPFKDRVVDVMDDKEFELRQQIQAELIRLSSCDTRDWIECYSARFARLWEKGIMELEDMIDNLYDERDPFMMELILRSGLGAQRWKKMYEKKFDAMWNSGDFESMGKESFGFILYNK